MPAQLLITTEFPEQQTAWTKARRDVFRFASQLGLDVLSMPAGLNPLHWSRFLGEVHRRTEPGGGILLEYPFEQRKRLYPLAAYCRWRGLRLHGLIHDLNALRYDSPPARELTILKRFDALVSHNPAMTAWLRAGGLEQPIVDLDLFDYLAEAPQQPWHETSLRGPLKVVCAGNLSPPKAGYIYDPRLGELEGVELSLFGAFFEPERMPPSPVKFKGVFDADHPALDGPYHFGLVWDGDGVAECGGRYGRYMRYNNPHKVSLYAALGLPVIVWREAAIARFVLEQGVGVAVDDLRELGQLASRLSEEEYRAMSRRMGDIGVRARRGDFLRHALYAIGATELSLARSWSPPAESRLLDQQRHR